MAKFENILLISDMDGTLFSKPDTIPQINLDAINYFIENGGRFTVATGRSQNSVRHYLKQLPINAPAIVGNGTSLYDCERLLSLCEFYGSESMKDISIQTHNKYPELSCFILSNGKLFTPKICEHHDMVETLECTKSTLIDMMDVRHIHWNKVAFIGEPQQINDAYDLIDSFGDNSFDYVKSAPYIMELIPKNINKGSAVRELSEMLNIPISNICAIGDYYNDEQMLDAAGMSASPSNAPKAIQDLVDFVACDHKDGAVADFIHYIENHIDSFIKG